MAVKRINHVALVVPDIEEATAFYRDVLGLRLERVERIGRASCRERVSFLV